MPNKALQVTFDPLSIFATAKTGIASNTAELKRWAAGVVVVGTGTAVIDKKYALA